MVGNPESLGRSWGASGQELLEEVALERDSVITLYCLLPAPMLFFYGWAATYHPPPQSRRIRPDSRRLLGVDHPLELLKLPGDRPAQGIELFEKVLGAGAGDAELAGCETDGVGEAGDGASFGWGGGDLEADGAGRDLESRFLEDGHDAALSGHLGEVG